MNNSAENVWITNMHSYFELHRLFYCSFLPLYLVWMFSSLSAWIFLQFIISCTCIKINLTCLIWPLIRSLDEHRHKLLGRIRNGGVPYRPPSFLKEKRKKNKKRETRGEMGKKWGKLTKIFQISPIISWGLGTLKSQIPPPDFWRRPCWEGLLSVVE